MIRWLRVVLPSLGWLIGFALIYGAWRGMRSWLEWRLGVRLPEDARWQMIRTTLCIGLVAFAVWRATAFHPLYRPGYFQWLSATPWTSGKPLPAGPVHLVLQDVVLVGAVALIEWWSGDGWFPYYPRLFLIAYLVVACFTFFMTGAWHWGYGVAFGLGLIVWRWQVAPAFYGAASVTYALAFGGLRWSLRRFPWDGTRAQDLHKQLAKQAEQCTGDMMGWPFGRLGPTFQGFDTCVPFHHALLISMLAAWYSFAAVSLVPLEGDRLHTLVFLFASALGLAPVRLVTYCAGHRPPISLLGRLLTGRWLISGYDQVFVAPLLAVWIGISAQVLIFAFGLDPFLCEPLIIGLVLFTILAMGPSLKVWRLTGNHRIVEGILVTGNVQVG